MNSSEIQASSPGGAQETLFCPACGKKGRPVKLRTLRSLLKPEALSSIGVDGYRYCGNRSCNLVYYAKDGGRTFSKGDLKVRLGVKETSAPRPICYCFGHTVEGVFEEIRTTGKSTVLEDIKTRLKDGCWCETTNPQGSCCLGVVKSFVKEGFKRFGKDKTVDNESQVIEQHDCCPPTVQEISVSAAEPANSLPAGALEKSHQQPSAWPKGRLKTSIVEKVATGGALFSALVASACCWLPLLLLTLGASGGAASTTFEAYRPLFMVLTFGFLGTAFYFTHRQTGAESTGAPRPSDGELACAVRSKEEDCCRPTGGRKSALQKWNKVMLWVATAVALAFLFFPNYVDWLL